jgi:hypothetical protein
MRESLESRFREEGAELRAGLDRADVEIRKVRAEVASAFESVLEFVGLSEDDAKTWVNDNLR